MSVKEGGVEMNQSLYAHMNNKRKIKKKERDKRKYLQIIFLTKVCVQNFSSLSSWTVGPITVGL
jgi:hypothetical protein